MKKQVLSALALCTCLGVAQAQTDVTGEYLVNPSFETLKAADGTTDVAVKTELTNGLQGWKINNETMPEIDSEASGANSWFGTALKPSDGTYFYLNGKNWMYGEYQSQLETTTSQALPAGNYYIAIDYKAADYSNNNMPQDNGTAIGIQVSDASENILGGTAAVRRAYSLGNNGGNTNGDTYMETSEWNEVGAMFTVTEPTVVTISIQQNLKSRGRSEVAYDNMRLYLIGEVPAEGIDVSGLISTSNNYAFAGWAIEGGNKFQVNTWSKEGDTDGSGMTTPFIEDWVGKGTNAADANISYTLNGLIPGVYEVSGLIRVLNEAGGATPAGATLYANEGTTDACDGTACTNGVYGTYTVKGTVTADGTLKFGIEIKNANFNWVAFKNFTLKYLGEAGADELKAALNAQLTEAKTYVEASPAAVKDMLENAITAGEAAASGDDTEAINAAIEALANAIETAKAIIPAADELEGLIGTCESIAGHSYASEAATSTFQAAIEAAQKVLDESTEANAISDATPVLEAARQAYVLKAKPKTGYTLDYNFLVAEVGNSTAGWTNQFSAEYTHPQNYQYQNSNNKDTETLKKTGYIEAWNNDVDFNGTLTYTLTDLPNGHYKISAYAFTTVGGEVSFTANGESETLDNSTDRYTNPVIEDVIVTDGTLTFGLNIGRSSWIGITNIQLEYLSALETNVSLNITEAGWATLILPFEAEVPENVTAYTCGAVGEMQDGVATLTLAEADKLEANTPYILQGEGTYSFKGLSVATEDSYTVGLLTGTLVDMLAKEGTYVLQNQDSGVGFYKVGSDSQTTQPEIGAYRAYLNADAVAGGNVQAFILKSIDGDGTTTGIDSTVAEADATVNVYNLNGILVRQNVKMSEALDGLQKGIYIVNGTKKAVK